MRIVFATKNEGKIKELTEMFAPMDIELVSLNHFEFLPEIVEDGKNYLGECFEKSKNYFRIHG